MHRIINKLYSSEKPFLSIKDYILLERSKHRTAIQLFNLMDSNLERSPYSWKDILYNGFSRYFLQSYNVCKDEKVTLFGFPPEIHSFIGSFLHPSDFQRKPKMILTASYEEDPFIEQAMITSKKRIRELRASRISKKLRKNSDTDVKQSQDEATEEPNESESEDDLVSLDSPTLSLLQENQDLTNEISLFDLQAPVIDDITVLDTLLDLGAPVPLSNDTTTIVEDFQFDFPDVSNDLQSPEFNFWNI